LQRDILRWLVKKKDEVDKMRFMIKAYDRYLRRNLKLQFNDFEIYSSISNSNLTGRNESIVLVCSGFDSTDKFEPIKVLSTFFKGEHGKQFLSKDSLEIKIRELGGDLGWIISAVVVVVGALISIKPTT
jgi:hypothetical protein